MDSEAVFGAVSFGASIENEETQDFFYDCSVHTQDTFDMDQWTNVNVVY